MIGVGGIDRNGARWDDCNDGLSLVDCAGNFGRRGTDTDLGIEVSAPAQQVAAGFHIDRPYAPDPNRCDDSWVLPDHDGYGWCSGTSMATPIVSGIVGIMRSINPLVAVGSPTTPRTIREALKISTNRWQIGLTTWNEDFGYGVPDAEIAARIMLGEVNQQTVINRATPLFSMYNNAKDDRTYTAIPQLGATFSRAGWVSEGAVVSNYTFPESQHNTSPPLQTPKADVYVLTTEYSPFPGKTLVPLYELTFEHPNENGTNPNNVDWLLVTSESDVEVFTSLQPIGYMRRGIQGYIFAPCSPEPSCIPEGAVKLYRAYDLYDDDHAVFPESKTSYMQSLGYTQNLTKLGYAYPNTDSDSDGLIDGMEYVIGTDSTLADSDCDGQSDGYEFPQAEISRSDPLDGSCSSGQPQTPWASNSGTPTTTIAAWNYVLGYHFTPLVDGNVNKLGGYFNGAKTVKLFNKTTGAVLATTTVTSSNNWSFSSITPVAVTAGSSYTVAVYWGGSGYLSYEQLQPVNYFPNTYGDITITASTTASTSSNPDIRPTNNKTSAMYG